MFKTLRTQILFFITLVIVIAAITIMCFTYMDVGRSIIALEEYSVQNISHLIQLNLKNEYDQLIFSREDSMRRLKKELKELTDLNIAIHQAPSAALKADIERGTREDSLAVIKKITNHWLHSPLVAEDTHWLVYDENGQAVGSSREKLNNINITSFLDRKGMTLDENLSIANLNSNGEFAVFQLTNEKGRQDGNWKLGYFMPMTTWNMVFSAITEMSSLAREEEGNIQRIITSMQQNFDDLEIVETGFVFVFDGQKNILIPPNEKFSAFVPASINPVSGHSYLDDFMILARKAARVKFREILFSGSEQQVLVYTSYFQGLDWYISIVLPVEEVQRPAGQLITRQSYIIAAIFFFSLMLCFFLVTRISRPLQILTEKIKRLPKHDFTIDDNENLLNELPVSSNNEVGRLAKTFGFMISELQTNINKLIKTTAQKERMESELNVAREIQMGSLPTKFSFDPSREELDIHACLLPAREVGGDLYDFFFIDDDHLCFTLGDVADKGVPAALFMVITKVLVKNSAQGDMSPARMMSRINNILCQDNPNAMFVTLIIGILNVRTGEIRYANGGHNPPIFSESPPAQPSFRKDLSGPAVGAIPSAEYQEISTTLKPGESIFLYTDGVTEAMDAEHKLFSNSRLLEEFILLEKKLVEDVIAGILNTVRTHAGQAPQSDDIAMMMIRWNGVAPGASPD